jgi:hypothetical protein
MKILRKQKNRDCDLRQAEGLREMKTKRRTYSAGLPHSYGEFTDQERIEVPQEKARVSDNALSQTKEHKHANHDSFEIRLEILQGP